MGVYIIGFIIALILAAIVIGWIAYCLFIRERHKSELYQYDIADLKHRNYLLSGKDEDVEKEKELTAGVIFVPSRHKQTDDDYEKRPDYPESPAPISPNTDRLIEILDDNSVETTAHYKDGIYEVDSVPARYHSDV